MPRPTFSVRHPDFKAAADKAAAQYLRDQKRAAAIATDKVSREYQRLMQAEMSAAGLGRLGGAVKQTTDAGDGTHGPSGIVYAAGGDESLAGGALDAYTNGVTIRANQRSWLAFATKAVPSRVGRYRMTPALYVSSGLNSSIGKLQFRPVNSRLALLVVKNVGQHVRTGRIKALGKRASKVNVAQKEVVCFVLIRFTVRAKRIDKDSIALAALTKMPDYIADALGYA